MGSVRFELRPETLTGLSLFFAESFFCARVCVLFALSHHHPGSSRVSFVIRLVNVKI